MHKYTSFHVHIPSSTNIPEFVFFYRPLSTRNSLNIDGHRNEHTFPACQSQATDFCHWEIGQCRWQFIFFHFCVLRIYSRAAGEKKCFEYHCTVECSFGEAHGAINSGHFPRSGGKDRGIPDRLAFPKKSSGNASFPSFLALAGIYRAKFVSRFSRNIIAPLPPRILLLHDSILLTPFSQRILEHA